MTSLEALLLRIGAGMGPTKDSVLVVAVGNVDLVGLHTEDGIALAEGDRVGCVGQTDPTQNGVYIASTGVWERAQDSGTSRFIRLGMTFRVRAGSFAGSVWALTSPTTGTISLGSTALSFAMSSPPDVAPLPANGSVMAASGTDDLTAMTAAVAAGRTLYLVGGRTYRLASPGLAALSGMRIVCRDRENPAIIKPATAWAPANGSADDRTIALLSAVPTLGAVNTTLASVVYKGQRQIQLTSATGVVTGTRLRLGPGTNVGGDATDMSDGASVSIGETVEVASVSGAWATLTEPCAVHHKTGKAVRSLATYVEDIYIEGVRFHADGKNLPTALRLDNVRRAKIVDCDFVGFSRAGVERLMCKDVEIIRPRFVGGINCGVYDDSSHFSPIVSPRRPVEDANRVHPQGTPRALLFSRNRCVAVDILDAELRHCAIGVARWGGWHCRTEGKFHDCDASAVKSRNAEYSGHTSGIAYEGGPGLLSVAEFAIDETLEVDASECRSDEAIAVLSPYAIYLHDSFYMKGRASFVNKGLQYASTINGDAAYDVNGINMQDISGHLALSVIGAGYNCRLGGTFVGLTGTFSSNGSAGGGAADGFGIYIDCAGDFSGPRWSQVTFTNAGVFVGFGANWAAGPDAYMQWGDCQFGSQYFSDVVWCYTTGTPVPGVLMKVDDTSPAGTVAQRRRMIASAGAGDKSMVAATAKNNNGALFAPLPGRRNSVYMTAATALGALLKNNGAGEAVVDAAVGLSGYIGKCALPTSGAGFSMVTS